MANCVIFKNLTALKLVLALFLQTCCFMGTTKSIGVFLPELEMSLGLSSTDIALALGFFGAFAFGPGPFVAYLYRRLPRGYRRHLMITGAFLASGGLILGSLVTSNAQLATCLTLAGLGSNTLSISLIIALSDQSGDAFGILYGIGKSGYAFGMSVVPLLADYLMRVYGWRGSLMIIGGFMANLIPLTMMADITVGHDVGLPDALGSSNSGAENVSEPLELDATEDESFSGDTRLPDEASIRHQDKVVEDGSLANCDSSSGNGTGPLDAVYNETITDTTTLIERPPANQRHTGVANDMSRRDKKIISQTNCSELPDNVCRILHNSIYNKDRWLILLMVASLLFAMVNGGWYAFLIPRAVGRGIPTMKALALSYSAAIAVFIGRCFGSILLDYKLFSGQKLFLFLTLLDITSLLADILVPKFALMVVTSFISSLSLAFRSILVLVICKDRAPMSEFPLILASTEIMFGLGMFVGISLSGFAADTYGDFNASFMFLAAVDTLVFCIMIPPTISKKYTEQKIVEKRA